MLWLLHLRELAVSQALLELRADLRIVSSPMPCRRASRISSSSSQIASLSKPLSLAYLAVS
jgi:hypothetical protein